MLGLLGVGPLRRFFPLRQSFFGLTGEFKPHLLEEVWICMKHIGATYGDVMSMPTYERRFFITKLIEENTKKQEVIEEQAEQTKTVNGKGSRTTTISGDALKAKMQSGQIPNE